MIFNTKELNPRWLLDTLIFSYLQKQRCDTKMIQSLPTV
jgi:hypothetical protein